MNDENDPRNELDDAGAPVAELAAFLVPVRSGFIGRLRRRLQRRLLAGQVIQLSWFAPLTVFMEFLSMLFEMLSGGRPGSGGTRADE